MLARAGVPRQGVAATVLFHTMTARTDAPSDRRRYNEVGCWLLERCCYRCAVRALRMLRGCCEGEMPQHRAP